ncbi:hypothetical protein SDJN03_24162, partial [Cucurbita argyrosperma subsp. sororia]
MEEKKNESRNSKCSSRKEKNSPERERSESHGKCCVVVPDLRDPRAIPTPSWLSGSDSIESEGNRPLTSGLKASGVSLVGSLPCEDSKFSLSFSSLIFFFFQNFLD